MPAKIQIKKRDGGFQFIVVGQNGRTIAASEPYASKASCVNGIKALQRAATSAQVEDQTSKEWLARQAAPTPPAKAAKTAAKAAKTAVKAAKTAAKAAKTAAKPAAPPASKTAKTARAAGKAVGKAKAKVEKAVAPSPAPPAKTRRPRPPRI